MVNKLQVLIMDDDEMVLEIGKEVFSVLDHDVECVNCFNDLEEQYRNYRKNNIDTIVIMDMIMPGQDDIQTCLKRLKKIDPDVIACITSGYTDDEKMMNPREYGFAAAIPKPYMIKDIEILMDTIVQQEE
ncbi:MAG: response regulator [Spirochaetota bacterium]